MTTMPRRSRLLLCIFQISLLSLIVSGWTSTTNAMVTRRRHRATTSTKTALAATTSSTSTSKSSSSIAETLASLEHAPSLIVFDLDNTLWTPELYQIRQKQTPVAGRDIRLFPGAVQILQYLWIIQVQAQMKDSNSNNNNHALQNTKLAIASRTNKKAWAEELLKDFLISSSAGIDITVADVMAHVEIYTGSKKKHFAALRESAGCKYGEMLFFDDDARLNLGEVSQLGVLCCHTPQGITVPHFEQSLLKYSELRAGHDAGHWMGHVLNDKNLNLKSSLAQSKSGPSSDKQADAVAVAGRVKFYSAQKKFGFIVNVETGEEYFVHESKVPAGINIVTGDSVVFEAGVDGTGRNFAVVVSVGGEDSNNTGSKGKGSTGSGDGTKQDNNMVEMPCFTMSQPFAALLLNGIKTVETRNNPMFQDVPAGTKVLLHCGRKDWPDQESYIDILKNDKDKAGGYSDTDIESVSRLRKGFSRGSIIGVLTVGRTWKATDRERMNKDLQRRVLAPYEAVGKHCTEIVDAKWLKRPVNAKGNPGVLPREIPIDCLPE
jgi:magnesium-dependent phosphatase 1